MTSALIISNFVLWAMVVVLALVVLALTRQVGVLHERVAPAGALMISGGPKVGEAVTPLQVQDIGGRDLTIGGISEDGRSTMLFFLSPSCPVCKTLLPVIRSSAASERKWLDVVLASDGELTAQRKFVDEYSLDDFPYVVSTELGMSFQVGKLPFVVLVDEAGVLRAKGLVNSREHLESLFEAKDRGVASIQEYLERTGSGAQSTRRSDFWCFSISSSHQPREFSPVTTGGGNVPARTFLHIVVRLWPVASMTAASRMILRARAGECSDDIRSLQVMQHYALKPERTKLVSGDIN